MPSYRHLVDILQARQAGMLRYLFVQAFDVNAQTSNHEIDACGSGSEALVDKSQYIAVDATKGIGGNNAQANFIGDNDKCLG